MKTIINSDRVLVLDKGEMVEFDKPENLLQVKTLSCIWVKSSTGQSRTLPGLSFRTFSKKKLEQIKTQEDLN